jgi:hypothetical protein
MWTPVALCAATMLITPIVVLVLFRLAALKRADDLKASPRMGFVLRAEVAGIAAGPSNIEVPHPATGG